MNWYESDVKAAIAKREACIYEPETVFYGSSTFTLWPDIDADFSEFKPVNLGFGGSTLTACLEFFERIVTPVKKPQRFLLYAGDNDLGDGASAHQVLSLYLQLKNKVRQHYGDIPFYYISIKPSLLRFKIIERIKQTNLLISNQIKLSGGNDFFINTYDSMLDEKGHPQKRFFEADDLHLNEQGYDVWREAILNELAFSTQLM